MAANENEADDRALVAGRALDFVHRACAHDVRGNLNSLVLNVELLKLGREPEQADRLETIEAQLRQLGHRAGALLTLTRPPVDPEGQVDLRDVASDVAAVVSSKATIDRIEFGLVPAVSPVVVRGQPQRLRSGLLSVVVCCLKAAPASIAMRLQRAADGAGCVSIELEGPSPAVRADALAEAWSPARKYGSLELTATPAGSRVEIRLAPTPS